MANSTPDAWARIPRGAFILALVAAGACSAGDDPAPAGEGGVRVPKTPGPTTEQPRTLPPPVLSGPVFLEAVAPTSLGADGFSANGRVQPRGRPATYWFEYGTTTSYGMRTEPRPLGPRLTAHYHESWDQGLSGWEGGMSALDLRPEARGGALNGYVRFSEDSADDKNHADGVGYIHLTQYLASGTFVSDLNASFSGGDPDFRDARVSFYTRGSNWAPNGSELIFWIQSDLDLKLANDPLLWRKANWAYTGSPFTERVLSGVWEKVSYQLTNDTNAWSFAGQSLAQARSNYVYWTLDEALGHVNSDFIHVAQLIRPGAAAQPTGAIDYDEFDIVYRNTSLLAASNGGKLIASPVGGMDSGATLTDGWRFGADRSWRSATNPSAPLEFTYELANPVRIDVIQIHQHPEWPSRDVEVSVSTDGKAWTALFADEMPDSARGGPNFAYLRRGDLDVSARFVKVTVSSGYRSERWGLGEIEAFGTGATMETDDDWYNVNRDIRNLVAGTTYHYRLVAQSSEGTAFGGDQTFSVPLTPIPQVRTGIASRVKGGAAKIEGRVNPVGLATTFHFEYGRDTMYGQRTVDDYCGVEQSPRTVIGELSALAPGVTYHYRLVAENVAGTALGADQAFVAK